MVTSQHLSERSGMITVPESGRGLLIQSPRFPWPVTTSSEKSRTAAASQGSSSLREYTGQRSPPLQGSGSLHLPWPSTPPLGYCCPFGEMLSFFSRLSRGLFLTDKARGHPMFCPICPPRTPGHLLGTYQQCTAHHSLLQSATHGASQGKK